LSARDVEPADQGLPKRRGPTVLRAMQARPRLLASIAVAVVAYFVQPASWHLATRLLIAWNVGTIIDIALTLHSMAVATTKTIRWRAAATDDGKWAILGLTTVAALAALGAIFAQLAATKDVHGALKTAHLGLAGLTIVSAWVFIHMVFALHYAHEYFDETKVQDGEKFALRGGLRFPETDEPDYWDFLYFSFIIGVAAQTADVEITSKVMRRTSLGHSVLAFFFNSAILALTINIAAGLV
jgi:uncharacterized membrane protein